MVDIKEVKDKVDFALTAAYAKALCRMRKGDAEEGQGAAEYAVIVGLLLVVVATAGVAFSDKVADLYQWGIDQMNTIQATSHTPNP